MDIDKAKVVCELYSKRDLLISIVKDLRVTLGKCPPGGTTTITIPSEFLPFVIEAADNKISELGERLSRM